MLVQKTKSRIKTAKTFFINFSPNKKCRLKRDDIIERTISLATTQHKRAYLTKYMYAK